MLESGARRLESSSDTVNELIPGSFSRLCMDSSSACKGSGEEGREFWRSVASSATCS